MSCALGMITEPKLNTNPYISAPTNVPQSDPSPPIITITKHSTIMIASMPGVGLLNGEAKAPPTPARAEPSIKMPL